MSTKRFSVCVLLFGDHLQLAQRCLKSIEESLEEARDYVTDFRIALNSVVPETAAYAFAWSWRTWYRHQLPTIVYRTSRNVYKYPIMRRMVFDPESPIADFVMWFDDDSFLQWRAGWWRRVSGLMDRHDQIGQCCWFKPIEGNQWAWIQQQPWFNRRVGPPPLHEGKPSFRFCQGAWWVVRGKVLRDYDWPTRELQHNGGDSMFGELFRHQGLSMATFDEGVRVNADEFGRHSASPRRGHNQPTIGTLYQPDATLDLDFHDFSLRRVVVGERRPVDPVSPLEVVDADRGALA